MHSTLTPIVRATGEGRQVVVGAQRITFTATAAETGGRFELYDFAFEPTESPLVRHLHLHMDELLHVTSGELEVAIGTRVLAARTGSTIFIPRGIAHGFLNRGPGRASALVQFTPSGLRDQFFERLSKLTGGPIPATSSQLADLGRRFDELSAEEEHPLALKR